MTLLIVAILGAGCGYLAIWSSIVLNSTVEERVRSLLLGVVIDVILLSLFAMAGSGSVFAWMLIFKYLLLAAVDLDKTLRQ
jgi:hypothetical protein